MNKFYLLLFITSILITSCGSGSSENSTQNLDSTSVSIDTMGVESQVTDTMSVDTLNN